MEPFECSEVRFTPNTWENLVLCGRNPGNTILTAAEGWRMTAIVGVCVLVERDGKQSILPWHCVTCAAPAKEIKAPRGRGRPPKEE
jgi:hypothetical protein